MERYICIHGHFYQPPRENAWLERVELQDSAYPFHDWNEKITSECYAPNSASRILNREQKIEQIVSNYSNMSFNFGPTLLEWMKQSAPDVYQAVLEADKQSMENFSGHGSALAQAYNHMIMPLADSRDKFTQVYWGMRDFEYRFQRKPEGMWLPETAVDLETLDIMAGQGIVFTILAPHQAQRFRKKGTIEWTEVTNSDIDPTRPYICMLPSGRMITLFFYDGPVSRAIAFENLLKDGELLAKRLQSSFVDTRKWPQIVHVATDGETYGHHHKFGDMALAYAINKIRSENIASITNYGEYLEKYPPEYEVEIKENTSWSCAHGIERWRSDCGCNSGAHSGWHQKWRAPLREALDWLRDTVIPLYEEKARQFVDDPWKARNDYCSVIIERSEDALSAFISGNCSRKLYDNELTTLLKLMELQRHALLMYTSCGWFFDDISGIETVQVIQYGARVLQLAGELFGQDFEPQFTEMLKQAPSNIRRIKDGKNVYERFAVPARVDLKKVTAHYAINSLFREYEEHAGIYCYAVDMEDYQRNECGRTRFVYGKVKVISEITREQARLIFGVLHMGDHTVNAGICDYTNEKAYQQMAQEIPSTFCSADFPETIRQLDRHFGTSTYSLKSLFHDEQRQVLDSILGTTLAETENVYRNIYDTHYPVIRYLVELGNPLPKAFRSAAELVLNSDIRRLLTAEIPDVEAVRNIMEDVEDWELDIDFSGLAFLFCKKIEQLTAQLVTAPEAIELLEQVLHAVELARSFPVTVDIWTVQNYYWTMLQSVYDSYRDKAQAGDERAQKWVGLFTELGRQLWIQI